jgi:glycosyltransferase involved in cell wall biosynthesis
LARGVQNKVLEAMAMAKPVLASPQAAEGIEARGGKELLVAADETEFVRQASRLLKQESAAAIGVAGRARVLASYAWESSLSRFEQLLTRDARLASDDHPASEHVVRAVRSGLLL